MPRRFARRTSLLLLLALQAALDYVRSTPLPGLPADGEEPLDPAPLDDGERAG